MTPTQRTLAEVAASDDMHGPRDADMEPTQRTAEVQREIDAILEATRRAVSDPAYDEDRDGTLNRHLRAVEDEWGMTESYQTDPERNGLAFPDAPN